jgi:hypothetical protein
MDKKGITKIRTLYYGAHAMERLEERNLMPSVIEDAIKHGEYLRLNNGVFGNKEIDGATGVYIKKNTALVIGKGRIGTRIIDLNRKREKYGHILVFTDNSGIVRSAYYASDNDLRTRLISFGRQRSKMIE